ncbi:MAG: hypothetical protein Q4A54_01695 [Parabacteroides sp.]|nr:hypothetical protein [Parabacteroides sp.]
MTIRKCKIRYHYEFPGLPITDADIQYLCDHTMRNIMTFSASFDILRGWPGHRMPDLFISDETIRRTYGKYSTNVVKKLIETYLEQHEASAYTGILRNLLECLDPSSSSFKELVDCLDREISGSRERDDFVRDWNPGKELLDAEEILDALKNIRHTVKVMGTYDPDKNKITLYVNTIADYFDKAPIAYDREKILTGMEIVLAHELFHFIHFQAGGHNKTERKKTWNCTSRNLHCKESVTEGLARWFEYMWCDVGRYGNKVYDWYIQEIRSECRRLYYPGWPYAAAGAFIFNNQNGCTEALHVFEESLAPESDHWEASYELLCSYDPHNPARRLNNRIHSPNPKMIFLTNSNTRP